MDGQTPNLQILLEILKRELSLHKQLHDVLKVEREALIGVSIKDIRECTFLKEGLLAEILREENGRRRWVQALADASGLDAAALSAEKVAELYGNTHFEQLVSVRNALRYMILQVREHNDENQQLTENALRESQLMKENALGMTGDRAATYGPKGAMGTAIEKNPRIFSQKA